VFEAMRLREDLSRAGINNKWWVVNQCLSFVKTSDPVLGSRAQAERQWIEKVREISSDHFATMPFHGMVSPWLQKNQ